MAELDERRVKLAQLVAQTIETLEARGVALPPDVLAFRAETFARGSGPGRRSAATNAVNAYQQDLQRAYQEWSQDLADDVAETDDEDERRQIIEAALAALAALLIARSHAGLTAAFTAGLAGSAPNPAMLAYLASQMQNADDLIANSCPAIAADSTPI
jgi:hypothetical protein